MASRVQRLCTELGWFSLEKLIEQFKDDLELDKHLSEYRELLEVEHMNSKLAEVMYRKGIKTCKELVAYSAEELAAYLHLSTGFVALVRLFTH